MYHNPLFAIDFYKVDHRRQYPEGTTEIYSNFTPRFVKKNHSLLDDFDNKVVMFGLQAFIQDYLIEQWDLGFLCRIKTRSLRNTKKSAKGLLNVEMDMETGRFYLNDDTTESAEKEGYLTTVFENGELLNSTDLCDIRHNLGIELQDVLE